MSWEKKVFHCPKKKSRTKFLNNEGRIKPASINRGSENWEEKVLFLFFCNLVNYSWTNFFAIVVIAAVDDKVCCCCSLNFFGRKKGWNDKKWYFLEQVLWFFVKGTFKASKKIQIL